MMEVYTNEAESFYITSIYKNLVPKDNLISKIVHKYNNNTIGDEIRDIIYLSILLLDVCFWENKTIYWKIVLK